jgi:hypothetical protein
MTKKFIVAPKGRSNFLIPDFINKSNQFISIDSGKKFSEGIVVYTGIDLTPKVIKEKITKSGIIDASLVTDMQITEFLTEIKNQKISHTVNVTRISDHAITLERKK